MTIPPISGPAAPPAPVAAGGKGASSPAAASSFGQGPSATVNISQQAVTLQKAADALKVDGDGAGR